MGLLNPYSAEFTHAQSDEISSLGEAVSQQLIAGKSVILQDPSSGQRVYLDDALRKGIINPDTGELFGIISAYSNQLECKSHCIMIIE